jgi:hypothetical protein
MVYQYNYCVSGHYPSSCFYVKYTAFQKLDSISVLRPNLPSWAQLIELVPITRHEHRIRVTLRLTVSQYVWCRAHFVGV